MMSPIGFFLPEMIFLSENNAALPKEKTPKSARKTKRKLVKELSEG